MSEDVIVEAHIDSEIRDRAEKVLKNSGMTMPEYIQLVVARVAEDGVIPTGIVPDPEYEAWVRAEIEEALKDESPGIPAEEVEAEFARKRAELLAKLGGNAA